VNKVSKKLCAHPGWTLSLDEMMKKFKGRSSETLRMPRKPAKKGFKFYAICDFSTGYVYHFFPSGRNDDSKIIHSVLPLLDVIPQREASVCCCYGQLLHYLWCHQSNKGEGCWYGGYCKTSKGVARTRDCKDWKGRTWKGRPQVGSQQVQHSPSNE
jgi:Transposase IS4